jgi:hypothetical protein
MRHFVNHFLTRFLRVASTSSGGGEHDARAVIVDFAFDLQVCGWVGCFFVFECMCMFHFASLFESRVCFNCLSVALIVCVSL